MHKTEMSASPDEASERILDIGAVLIIFLIALWMILPIPLALMLWFS